MDEIIYWFVESDTEAALQLIQGIKHLLHNQVYSSSQSPG